MLQQIGLLDVVPTTLSQAKCAADLLRNHQRGPGGFYSICCCNDHRMRSDPEELGQEDTRSMYPQHGLPVVVGRLQHGHRPLGMSAANAHSLEFADVAPKADWCNGKSKSSGGLEFEEKHFYGKRVHSVMD